MLERVWTKQEDETIVRLYTIIGAEWEAICKELPERSVESCKRYMAENHANLCPPNQPRKRTYPWTYAENRVFAALCRKNIQLSDFPKYLRGRSVRTCELKKQSGNSKDWEQRKSADRENTNIPWTTKDSRMLFNEWKANKSWSKISKILGDSHTPEDCRTHWFNKYWEEFNYSTVDGELDIERFVKKMTDSYGGTYLYDDEVIMEGGTDEEDNRSQ